MGKKKVVILLPCNNTERFDGCSVPHRNPEQMAQENGFLLVKKNCPRYAECDSLPGGLKKDCNNDVSDHHYNRKLSKDT